MRINIIGFIAALTLTLLAKDFIWFLLPLLASASLISLFIFKRFVPVLFILSGLLLGALSVSQLNQELKDVPAKGFISKELRVTDFPESRPDGQYNLRCGALKLISSNLSSFSPGDLILTRGYTRTIVSGERVFTQLYVTESTLIRKGPLVYQWINKLRLFVEERLNRLENKDTRTLLYCMILANANYIDYSTNESFKLSGVTHLLAISGLNVALISVVLAFIFGRFLLQRQASLLTMVVIILYIALAGFGPSIVRAGLMFIIYHGVRMSGLNLDFADSVLAAAFISLLYQPLFVYQGGFWLSYLAVLGIYYFTGPIRDRFLFLGRAASESIAVTLSATAMTLPLLLFYFKGISAIAPLANLLIIPAFNVLTCILFGDFILNIAGLDFVNAILDPVVWLFWSYSKLAADYLSRLPFAYLDIQSFSLIFMIIFFALILAALTVLPQWVFSYRMKKLRSLRPSK